VRYNYKTYPDRRPHPAFPDDTSWIAVLEVRLSCPAKQTGPTARFEAVVDSGCVHTVFHSDIGRSIGIDVNSGIRGELGGLVQGPRAPAYYHDVALHVDAFIITIRAGFSDKLPAAGILGRKGFFEHFVVRFDPTLDPPGFEIERVGV